MEEQKNVSTGVNGTVYNLKSLLSDRSQSVIVAGKTIIQMSVMHIIIIIIFHEPPAPLRIIPEA